MKHRRPGSLPRARWRRTVAVVAFVAMAATACTGDTDTVTDLGPDTETGGSDTGDRSAEGDTAPAGQTDLGRFEFSAGPGSLVVPITERLPDSDVLGPDWFAFPTDTKAVESCRFDDERAWAARAFSRSNGGESAAARIGVFPDPAAAEAALDQMADPGWSVCVDESLAQLNAKLDETGAIRAELVGEIGEPEASILPASAGFTRSHRYLLVGGGVELDLKITETSIVDDEHLITLQTALLDDRHVELTTAMGRAFDDTDTETETDFGTDAGLDANLEGLRRAVIAEDEAVPFYDLLLAARVGATGSIDCVAPDNPTVTMFGPTWATANGISAIIQLGRSYRTVEQAVEAQAALESIDARCQFDSDLAGSFAGEVFFEDSSVSVVERDGRRVLVIDISMTQRLDGNQAVDAETAAISTMTQVGTELVGWRFLGIRGDEPDLVQMTVDAAARVEGAP